MFANLRLWDDLRLLPNKKVVMSRTLLRVIAISSYLFSFVVKCAVSIGLEVRGSWDDKNCYRWACQVQVCLSISDDHPDMDANNRIATCLFLQQLGNDCGTIVSGIGQPIGKKYINCPANTTQRQFQYTIWRSGVQDMESDQFSLDADPYWYRFPLQAYGFNCTREANVKCSGDKSYASCGQNCSTKGCIADTQHYGNCKGQ